MACSKCEPRYTLIEKLLQRCPYTLHRAVNNTIGNVVSLIELKLEDDEGIPIDAIREIAALSRLRHPNVVKMVDVYANADSKAMSLAFELQCTNLQEHMQQHGPFEGLGLKRAAFQFAQGVAHIHSHGVSHRGLKATNVLIEAASSRVMLSDFSKAGCLRVSSRGFRGTPPEVHLGALVECGFSADIWALGSVVVEMVLARPLFPFDGYQLSHLFEIFKVLGTPTEATWPGVGKLPHFSSRFPKWCGVGLDMFLRKHGATMCEHGHQMLGAVLRLDPVARPCARSVVRHPYFYDIKTQPEVLQMVERCHTQGGPSSLSGPCAHMKEHGFASNFAQAFHSDLKEFLGEAEFQPCVPHLCSKQSCDSFRHAVGLTALAWQGNAWECHLWSLHNLAQKHRLSTEILLGNESRAEYVEWCLRAFDVLHLPDKVLFDTVMMMDRWWIAWKAEKTWESTEPTVFRAQCVLLAATLLSLKASSHLESLPGDGFACLINPLSKGAVQFQDVVAAELLVIKELHSSLGAPTGLDFLDLLGRKIAPSSLCRRLANFLLHLSIGDVDLHYGHPQVILAAAAWLLAMYATNDHDDSMTLLQNIAHGFPDTAWLCLELRGCIVGLLKLWTCARSPKREGCCKVVRDKFEGQFASSWRCTKQDDLSGLNFMAIGKIDVFVGAHSRDVLTTVQKDSIMKATGCIVAADDNNRLPKDRLPITTQHGDEGFVETCELKHVLDDVLRLIPQWCWLSKWLEKRLDTIA